MSTLAEIERAIEALPPRDVEALAVWLEARRKEQLGTPAVEIWLKRARGTAAAGITTEGILAATRGEE